MYSVQEERSKTGPNTEHMKKTSKSPHVSLDFYSINK